jgi:type I restriction enzyme S subunit
VDFDPVHAKAQGRQPEGMDEQTAALFSDRFVESELGMVPLGWDYVSLKEVVSIFDSQRIPLAGQERAKRKGEYPYYGAAALMDYVDDYIFDGVFLLTGEDGSVADSNGYPITQYVWGKIWVNNHAHVLQGKDGVSTEHLMMFLKRTNIEPFMTGAVQAKLSQSNMWRIMFLKPPHQISESFGCVIEPLFAKLRHNTEKAQTLTNLRDTLLPRLISGQLRLPDVEA